MGLILGMSCELPSAGVEIHIEGGTHREGAGMGSVGGSPKIPAPVGDRLHRRPLAGGPSFPVA